MTVLLFGQRIRFTAHRWGCPGSVQGLVQGRLQRGHDVLKGRLYELLAPLHHHIGEWAPSNTRESYEEAGDLICTELHNLSCDFVLQ